MNNHLTINHRLGEPLPRTIAIVRSLPGLGDLLCVVPALRALRAALPQARILLIGLPWANAIVLRFSHYLDGLLEFPGFPGIPEVPILSEKIVSFLVETQQMQLDLALQMHGNGTAMNQFTALLGATQQTGFFAPGYFCPDPDWFLPYPDHEPESWRHLRLLEFLGIPLQGDSLEFPIWSSDWQELEAIAMAHQLAPIDQEDYICIHPGASTGARRWSYRYFAQVADALAVQGYRIILTGTAAEQELTQAVAQSMRCPAIDLAGKTSLGAVAALIKRSRLLICNDTGISHLAAALQVNSVVIFSNSDPDRWAPLDRSRHRVVMGRPIRHRTGEQGSDPAFYPASPAAVLAEAIDLLHQEVAYAS
jgi:ADP-heptose:LPS heptosyltransferase